jgi:hypothetical protein
VGGRCDESLQSDESIGTLTESISGRDLRLSVNELDERNWRVDSPEFVDENAFDELNKLDDLNP